MVWSVIAVGLCYNGNRFLLGIFSKIAGVSSVFYMIKRDLLKES